MYVCSTTIIVNMLSKMVQVRVKIFFLIAKPFFIRMKYYIVTIFSITIRVLFVSETPQVMVIIFGILGNVFRCLKRHLSDFQFYQEY